MPVYKKNILPYAYVALTVVFLMACSSVKKVSTNRADQKKTSSQSSHTIWGSSAAPFPGEKVERKEAWIRLNEKIKSLNGGYGLQGHRSYDKGLPESWSASVMSEDEHLCKVSFGSIKPDWNETATGHNYEAIKKFVQSIPNDRVVYLTFYHEPEDNTRQKGYSAALLQLAFAKFVDAVLAANKPNVHPCFVLMAYTFRKQSGRNPDDFNMAAKLKPEQLNQVIAGIDGYAHDPEVSAKETFEANLAKMAGWGFSRFGIFETATHEGKILSARATWIKDLGQWVNSRKDIELVSWFNSGVGPHAGPKGWFLGNWSKADNQYTFNDNDGSVSAYAQLLKP